ncbi:flavin-containing monooxygenase [uncultured Friedmanniella sp.]|uniref:flavin-containing monooxygenase n=1 Tax=uncultured Friedmanniella sp. TaxID=335381 RepID=UPI0035CAA2EC
MADHVVDVLVVGAGVSGIGAAFRLQTECPDHTYAVVEARDAIGGTWDLFRFPGVRSDSDIFTFCYPFRPWDGDQSLADGEDIRRYVEQVAAENGIDRRIHFGTRVVSASWSSAEARWTVRTASAAGVQTWSCAFLYACAGYYDHAGGHTPSFPGQQDFGGPVVHPQSWPADLDVTGQRVVVIGSGATAVTLVPALAGTAARVTMLQRSPTWVTAQSRSDPFANRLRRRLPAGLAHHLIRTRNLAVSQAFYALSRRRPALARSFLRGRIAGRMGEQFTAEHFTPSYDPWDQRLCVIPDGDLMRAITRGDASVVTDTIERFVPEGVRLTSGRVLPADVIVTATGLRMRLLGGMALDVDGKPVVLAEHALYRGLMLDGVPNFAVAIGYINASWSLRADIASRYVCRFLRHLTRHGLGYGYPVRPPDLVEQPLMPLSSGYVRRALPHLPVQGSAGPWLMPQNYLRDLIGMRRADLGQDMHLVPHRHGAGPARPSRAGRTRSAADPAGPPLLVTRTPS